jgi:subtilisin family serine protease
MRLLLALGALALVLPAAAVPGELPIVIAVVDSGVDPSVPRLVAGRNVLDGSADTHDDAGHGTGVARVVAAGTSSCDECRVMPVKIDSNGTSTQGTISAGIRWAAEHGARVINMSWGSRSGSGRRTRSSVRSRTQPRSAPSSRPAR